MSNENLRRENLSKRNFQMPPELPDLFIAGLSGAGKDTISDYLRDYFDYNKLRLSETLKRIITEKENISFEELEVQKRTNPELRKAHTDFGDLLKVNGWINLNRLKLIINRKSMDFLTLDDTNPTCVCDVRGVDEAITSLQEGLFGIFLTRSNKKEFRSDLHWTDYGFFNHMIYPEDVKAWTNDNEGLLINVVIDYLQGVDYKFVIINNGKVDLTELHMNSNIEIIEFEQEVNDITNGVLLEAIDLKLLSKYS